MIETDYNYDFDSILQIWLRHYHLKYELITGDMNITLQKFIKNLGLTYSEEEIEGNHLALRFVDGCTKKIKLRLNKNDCYSFNAKFNYLMYLLGICAEIDVDGKKAKREEEAKRWFVN